MHVFMEVAGKVFKAPRSGVIAHCIARAMITEPWVRMTARRTRGKGVWDLGGRKCPPCSWQLCTPSINCGINTDTTLALLFLRSLQVLAAPEVPGVRAHSLARALDQGIGGRSGSPQRGYLDVLLN